MEYIVNPKWWMAALIRCVKTLCQTAIATIGTAAAIGQVDWLFVCSASVLAAFISLLTSLAGLPEVDDTNENHELEELEEAE